jgi:hypothetical protein
MSYDLAVWVGDVPRSDTASLAEYTTRMDAMEAVLERDADAEPHPRLLAFADALLSRYPDLDDDNENDTPWADAPIKNNIVGDLFYFSMAPSHAEGAIPFIVETADAHGLVCFDPQTERLLAPAKGPSSSRRWFRRG